MLYVITSSYDAKCFVDLYYSTPDWPSDCITDIEAAFLFDIMRLSQPSLVVELGIASGVSTYFISQLLKHQYPGAKLFSFDIMTHFYKDPSKRIGEYIYERNNFLPDNLFLQQNTSSLNAGNFLMPWSANFIFYDSNNIHPWPTLSLLSLMRCIAPGSWIVMRCIHHPFFCNYKYYEFGSNYLYETWPGKKIVYDHKQLCTNIGAIKLSSNPLQNIRVLLHCLRFAWQCRVSSGDIDIVYQNLLPLSEECANVFYKIALAGNGVDDSYCFHSFGENGIIYDT